MPRTPDRKEGPLEEYQEVILHDNSLEPSVPGAYNYNGTDFQMRDAYGVFNPRDGGGGTSANFDDIILDEEGRIVYVGDGEFVLRY